MPAFLAARLSHNSRISRHIRPWINRMLPDKPTVVSVRSGMARNIRLVILPREEKFYWTGTYELPVQQIMSRILRPGMVFWDVGAHIGFFSLSAARLVGPTGSVCCFEPNDTNRNRLLRGIEDNPYSNLVVISHALDATDGVRTLHRHRSSSMWTLVPEFGESDGSSVICSTLDAFAHSLPKPDLIKIDAEGAEVDVIRGGMSLLSTQKPAVIVEFSNEALLAQARKLCQNYTFEKLGARHWLLQ